MPKIRSCDFWIGKPGSISTLSLPGIRCVQAMNEPKEAATEPVVGNQARGDISISMKAFTNREAASFTQAHPRQPDIELPDLCREQPFSSDSYSVRRQSGRTLIHADKRNSILPGSNKQYITDCSILQIWQPSFLLQPRKRSPTKHSAHKPEKLRRFTKSYPKSKAWLFISTTTSPFDAKIRPTLSRKGKHLKSSGVVALNKITFPDLGI